MSDDLPMGWVEIELGNIADFIMGQAPPSSECNFEKKGVPFVKAGEFGKKHPVIREWTTKPLKMSNVEDVLICVVGATCGKLNLGIDCAIGRSVAAIRAKKATFSNFLYYQLLLHVNTLRSESTGTAQGVISKDMLGNTMIALPPLNEQRRIVDKLDRIGDRHRTARNELNHIPKLIARYKQAVLSAACSGKLTEDWRETNNISFNWERVKMAEIGYLGRGKSKHRPRNDSRLYGGIYPFIQTGDIAQSNGRIESHSQTYSEFGLSQSKLWEAGTVCITIAANIGDTAILSYPACFPDSVVGFVCDDKKCLPEFFKWSIDMISEDLESFAPATAQKNINLAILNDIELFCPPFEEQKEIVRRVEKMFEKIDRMEQEYHKAAKLCDRLEQATLAKAFRGELVPQDPDDEPASVLLEQVKSQKEKGKKGVKLNTSD